MATLEFAVGISLDGTPSMVTVEAEDALIAALKVKQEKPHAVVNYVRKCNARGDRRHPHRTIGDMAAGQQADGP